MGYCNGFWMTAQYILKNCLRNRTFLCHLPPDETQHFSNFCLILVAPKQSSLFMVFMCTAILETVWTSLLAFENRLWTLFGFLVTCLGVTWIVRSHIHMLCWRQRHTGHSEQGFTLSACPCSALSRQTRNSSWMQFIFSWYNILSIHEHVK